MDRSPHLCPHADDRLKELDEANSYEELHAILFPVDTLEFVARIVPSAQEYFRELAVEIVGGAPSAPQLDEMLVPSFRKAFDRGTERFEKEKIAADAAKKEPLMQETKA
ncbi:hypothetical protein VTK26DRAFT_4592 [Humicola hyalothermophila]